MHIHVTKTGTMVRAEIQGNMVFEHVREAKRLLQQAADSRMDMEIDLSRVASIDIAGLQVIFSARNHLCAVGNLCRLVRPSKEVIEVLSFLGRGDLLEEISLEKVA
jgi:anti-anti-sigma factor